MSTKFWKRPAVLVSLLIVVAVVVVLVVVSSGKANARPTVPQSVSAVATNGTAVISWSAPSSNGGAAIASYVVTSHPDARTCSSTTTTCTISGLTNGKSYTFTVVARNKVGTSPISAPSKDVMPKASIASAPSLTVKPSKKLTNGSTVTVSGANFTPNDHLFLVECLANAKGQGGCDVAAATPVTVSAVGILPGTTFTVVTGAISAAPKHPT